MRAKLPGSFRSSSSSSRSTTSPEARRRRPRPTPREQQNALAKMLANPVANLWSLQFQFDNVELTNGRWNYSLNFQPVMPVSLTKDLNLVARPVVPVYNSAPYQTSTGAERPHDQLRRLDAGGALLAGPAAGNGSSASDPTFIFPTAGSTYTGTGKVAGRTCRPSSPT